MVIIQKFEKPFDSGHILKLWPKGFAYGLDVNERCTEE